MKRTAIELGDLTYPQWFALLGMKCFGPERPGRIIRYPVLASLVRRRLAIKLPDGRYAITIRGLRAQAHDSCRKSRRRSAPLPHSLSEQRRT
jgi:hypothetical protein